MVQLNSYKQKPQRSVQRPLIQPQNEKSDPADKAGVPMDADAFLEELGKE